MAKELDMMDMGNGTNGPKEVFFGPLLLKRQFTKT
jgi:hypothetical protein